MSAVVPADPRIQDVGFAKLQGSGIDHVMRTYEIVLGRASKDARPDVVLGDTKSVSRQHARIYFNFDSGWLTRPGASLIHAREILLFIILLSFI